MLVLLVLVPAEDGRADDAAEMPALHEVDNERAFSDRRRRSQPHAFRVAAASAGTVQAKAPSPCRASRDGAVVVSGRREKMSLPDERYRRGVEILERLSGDGSAPIADEIAEVAPDFARMTIEFLFGDLYSRAALDLRTRELAAIAVFASLGRIPHLRAHVGAAIHVGCTPEEVIEILMQTAIHAGFPAALDALTQCHDLLVDGASRRAPPLCVMQSGPDSP
jgi:4-carboxymuconolactone decarboxylase